MCSDISVPISVRAIVEPDLIIDCGCVEPKAEEYKSTFNLPVLRKGIELESLSLKLWELLSANGEIFIANVVFVTANPVVEATCE